MVGLQTRIRTGLLLSLFVFAALDTSAQPTSSDGSRRALRGEAQMRLSETDSLLEFRTRRVHRGRVDLEAGILRAAYRIPRQDAVSGDAPRTARSYLESVSSSYGLSSGLEDLVLLDTRATPHSSYVVFQQVYAGVPVLNGTVKVNLDRSGHPSMVLSSYAPHVRRHRQLSVRPDIGAGTAEDLARSVFTGGADVGRPELYVLPQEPPRLVWRMQAVSLSPPAEWEILIDAHTGEVARVVELAIHGGQRAGSGGQGGQASHAPGAVGATEGLALPAAAKGEQWERSSDLALVDGSGLIFDPDPLTSAGVAYGSPYTDSNDADVPELNAQRKEAVLREITQGGDGLYRLEGPYARIVGDAQLGGIAYEPPATTDPHSFRYLRSNPFFEGVMAYYHVDASLRYASSLGVSSRPTRTVAINPRGFSSDDSQYFPVRHAIAFGTGGIDDAEDASVIWHESAHALLENESPGLLATFEGRAFHEGWADYWAASYVREKIDRSEVPPRDWRGIFFWDGNSGTWCGRIIDHPGRYPDQTSVQAPAGCRAHGDIYQLGLLWAATVMEIYSEIGRDVTDRLSVASHFYLNAPIRMSDAAEAMIQADVDLHGGAHTEALIRHFSERGFVDGADFGPIVMHEPLRNTEAVGSVITIDVSARGSTSPIDSVMIFYGTSPVPVNLLVLLPVGDGIYEAELQLPSQPDTLRYYVEVVDQARRRSRLPAGDAGASYQIIVGPDTRAPIIEHIPIGHASLAAWPAELIAVVTDDIGVDSVWAEFTLEGPSGSLVREGHFGLERAEHQYFAPFAISVDELTDGSTVSYRLFARDVARSPNVAVFPDDGPVQFTVIGRGLLRMYDFEILDAGIQATGVWSWGPPSYGLRVAHSASNVWATAPAAAYPAQAQRSSLDLPPVNLEGLEGAYLVFWHWYDFEHNGQAEPGVFQSIPLWDGGNVKLSQDDGATWSVIAPEGGYNGIISAGFDNPLGGEPGFGGYSFGWRQEVVSLPAVRDLRIRFDFGTDGSNSEQALFFAGWHIDDVSITTDLPPDESAPVVQSLPDQLLEISPGQTPPRVMIRAFDDVGIERAEATYTVSTTSGEIRENAVRLAMADTSLFWYAGEFPGELVLEAGDRIDYRIRLVDFAGNQSVVPTNDQPPLRISSLHLSRINVLQSVRHSGNWTLVDSVWSTITGPEVSRSALVSDRFDLSTNADRMTLELRHAFVLDSAAGANVKVTEDGGRTWTVLVPEGGYPGVLNVSPEHVMSGEEVFVGDGGGIRVHRFDMSAYGGKQVQLRLDVGSARALRPAERWSVYDAVVSLAGLDARFPIDPTLALHPNYPDPFSNHTTVSFSLASDAHVNLEVYDMLGRRITVLVDGEHRAGSHTLTFDGSTLASGIYMLRMRVGGEQRVERMVIAR